MDMVVRRDNLQGSQSPCRIAWPTPEQYPRTNVTHMPNSDSDELKLVVEIPESVQEQRRSGAKRKESFDRRRSCPTKTRLQLLTKVSVSGESQPPKPLDKLVM